MQASTVTLAFAFALLASLVCKFWLATRQMRHVAAHRDRVPHTRSRACPAAGVCQSNYAGFPAGMCSVSCDGMPEAATCGGIPQLRGFNDCLAGGRPFAQCIRANVRPSGLRACDEKSPCRDDYICAAGSSERGVCLPPYFLFQLRVDGHPRP